MVGQKSPLLEARLWHAGRDTRRAWGRTIIGMSDVARPSHDAPQGTSLLPRDLTADELAKAPVLASIDKLLIEDLSDDEDDAFAAALDA